MELFDDTFNSHMPFVFEGQLLHCRGTDRLTDAEMGYAPGAKYQSYDIHCSDLDGRNSFYIGASMGENVIACSPNAYRSFDGTVVLNYVAVRMVPGAPGYAHYQRRGNDLRQLGAPQAVPEPQGIYAACQSENPWLSYSVRKVAGESLLMQYDKISGKRKQWIFHGVHLLHRSVCVGATTIVLTYADRDNVTKSALFDTEKAELRDVKVDGKDVYKCHFNGDELFHAVRSTGTQYRMAIHRDRFTTEASSLIATSSPWY